MYVCACVCVWGGGGGGGGVSVLGGAGLQIQVAIIFLLFNSPSGLPDVIGIGWGHCGGYSPSTSLR